jgi:hypothetical protein
MNTAWKRDFLFFTNQTSGILFVNMTNDISKNVTATISLYKYYVFGH